MGVICLPGKIVEEHPRTLSLLTTPLRDPIREEANLYNKQRMHKLLLRQKNRHGHVNAYAWHGKNDAMQLTILSGIGIPTQENMVQVVFLPTILNVG